MSQVAVQQSQQNTSTTQTVDLREKINLDGLRTDSEIWQKVETGFNTVERMLKTYFIKETGDFCNLDELKANISKNISDYTPNSLCGDLNLAWVSSCAFLSKMSTQDANLTERKEALNDKIESLTSALGGKQLKFNLTKLENSGETATNFSIKEFTQPIYSELAGHGQMNKYSDVLPASIHIQNCLGIRDSGIKVSSLDDMVTMLEDAKKTIISKTTKNHMLWKEDKKSEGAVHVGDVHCDYAVAESVFSNFSQRIVFHGDYVDREKYLGDGFRTMATILSRLANPNSKWRDNTIMLMGTHELLALEEALWSSGTSTDAKALEKNKCKSFVDNKTFSFWLKDYYSNTSQETKLILGTYLYYISLGETSKRIEVLLDKIVELLQALPFATFNHDHLSIHALPSRDLLTSSTKSLVDYFENMNPVSLKEVAKFDMGLTAFSKEETSFAELVWNRYQSNIPGVADDGNTFYYGDTMLDLFFEKYPECRGIVRGHDEVDGFELHEFGENKEKKFYTVSTASVFSQQDTKNSDDKEESKHGMAIIIQSGDDFTTRSVNIANLDAFKNGEPVGRTFSETIQSAMQNSVRA